MIRQYSNKEIQEIIGERARKYRKNTGMSQKELSKATGLSLSSIQKFESGKANVNLDNFLNILRALGQIESIDLLFPDQPLSPYINR